MNNFKKLTKDIFLFTDLFDDLNQTYLYLQELDWQLWGRNNNDPAYKIGELAYLNKHKKLLDIIKPVTEKCIYSYMNELNIDSSLYVFYPESTYVRKWDFPMRGMNAHSDYTFNDDGSIRDVEYTLCGYLNDNYIGGLLEFPEHGISLKPPAGSAVVFPSYEVHLVTDLVEGHRYMWSDFVFKK